MSETRPVPRRESPWGLPEGDNRQPKAHRCNDRAEDVIQLIRAIRNGRPLANSCCLCCCNVESVDHLLLFLSDSSFFVDVYASVVWDQMGHARLFNVDYLD
nr:hypothetical protein CFP56_37445 [Quercus suber]